MTAACARAVLGGLLAVGPALAQPAAAPTAKQVEGMLARAVDDYDAMEFDTARRTLDEALTAIEEGKIADAKLAARTHALAAVVWIGGMRDRYRGFQEFLSALRIDPAIAVHETVATPEMVELLENARDALAAQEEAKLAAAGAAPGVRPTAAVRGLAHERVDEAWAGFAIPVRCELGPDVPAIRVMLFYRPAADEEFAAAELQYLEGGWSGSIPEPATHGRYLHYYLEARDRRGRAVAQSGSAASPNLIMLKGMSASAPRDVETVTAARIALGRRWTASIGVGTGLGVLGADESENCGANPGGDGCIPIDGSHPAVPINSGAASSPFHLLAEGGYRLTPLWEAAAQLRLQMISGSQVKKYDDKSFLGTVRFRRWIGQGRTRLFFATAVGVGQVRHAVDLGQDGGNVRDVLASGFFVFGGGGGLSYDIVDKLSVVGAIDALVLTPNNTAFHTDLNLGVRYAF